MHTYTHTNYQTSSIETAAMGAHGEGPNHQILYPTARPDLESTDPHLGFSEQGKTMGKIMVLTFDPLNPLVNHHFSY